MEPTETTPTKKKQPKWLKITLDVLFYVVLAFILTVAGFAIASKTQGDTLRFGDSEVRIVLTGSMDGEPTSYVIPTIKTGSAVVIKDTPKDEAKAQQFYEELEIGDILTFDYTQPNGKTVLVTHRIVEKDTNPVTGSLIFRTKGDNDSGIQTVNSDSGLIVGKVTGVSYGWGVFLTFITGTWGIILLVIVPSVAIFVYEIGKIIMVVNKDKKDKLVAEKAASDARVKELENQVKALQESKEETPQNDQPTDEKK